MMGNGCRLTPCQRSCLKLRGKIQMNNCCSAELCPRHRCKSINLPTTVRERPSVWWNPMNAREKHANSTRKESTWAFWLRRESSNLGMQQFMNKMSKKEVAHSFSMRKCTISSCHPKLYFTVLCQKSSSRFLLRGQKWVIECCELMST